MTDATTLLRAYDEQLREDAEVRRAEAVERVGPVRLATFRGGRAFVTYQALTGDDGAPLDAAGIGELVAAVHARIVADPAVTEAEWKTRGHDDAPGLHEALVAQGFAPGEPESIMLGEASGCVADVPLPPGVTLRRITERPDLERMEAMCAEAFGRGVHGIIDALQARLAAEAGLPEDERMALFVAELEGEVVSAGRLEPVPGTQFAGLWGGATRADQRGRGIYRALTAERARLALALGKRYLQSDSTEFSRPILERAGLVKVGTTTPYEWRRA